MSLNVNLFSKNHCVFDANITNNLCVMAKKAGIYKHIWEPEELKIKKANKLIKPLSQGLADMKNRKSYYEKFNSSNGWGLYENFIPWIEEYLNHCIKFPNAVIEVSK